MFYSGPREAIHHSILRKNLGFDQFLVGRDHAGAENVYKPNLAYQTVKKVSKNSVLKFWLIKVHIFVKLAIELLKKVPVNTKKCKYENISGKHLENILKQKILCIC